MEYEMHILQTYSTPEVNIDLKKGRAHIYGKSVPEDSLTFYKPILEFLDHISDTGIATFELTIELEYFNSNSSKFILDFFLKLAKLKQGNILKGVNVHWVVDKNDEDMIEAGEDYMAIVKIPFNIIHK